MNRFFLISGKLQRDKALTFTVDTHRPSNAKLQTHFALQSLMNHCINAAESVHDMLRTYILMTHSNSLEDQIRLAKTDFMGLRNLLSKHIKKYICIKLIEGYEMAKQISELTSILHQYISDRNIYTHGQLGYDVKKEIFCIKFFNGKCDDYAEVNIEIVNSFLEVTKELRSFLKVVKTMHIQDTKDGTSFRSLLK
jgi:hypothetical protein